MKLNTKCDYSSHKHEGTCKSIKWFTKGIGWQRANFCDLHSMELWESINPLLQINEAAIVIEPIEDALVKCNLSKEEINALYDKFDKLIEEYKFWLDEQLEKNYEILFTR